MNFASKLLICFLCVVKFRYVVSGLKDLKYGHAEKGINMCFMHTKKTANVLVICMVISNELTGP